MGNRDDVGDVSRSADRNRFASWIGTASIEAFSGEVVRHRFSGAGNRRMNHMLHIAATTQVRLDTEGRRYYRLKLAAGKTRMEAMRCLKRRISDAVYRQLIANARRAALRWLVTTRRWRAERQLMAQATARNGVRLVPEYRGAVLFLAMRPHRVAELLDRLEAVGVQTRREVAPRRYMSV